MTNPASALRRIGFLYPANDDAEFRAWKAGLLTALAAHGWEDGINLAVEWRFAAYDQTTYAALAADLAQQRVELVATAGTPLTRALAQASPSMPIVTAVGDPVASGFAASLQRPGGRVTGLSRALREKARRQFGLLLALSPAVQTLLILRSAQFGDLAELDQCIDAAAREHGLKTELVSAATFATIDAALAKVAGQGTVAGVAYGHGAFQFPASLLAECARRHRVATLSDEREFTEAGCLLSFSMTHESMERDFAAAIDRILRGANPGDIPFALPTRTELAIHLGTAGMLGLAASAERLRETSLANGVRFISC